MLSDKDKAKHNAWLKDQMLRRQPTFTAQGTMRVFLSRLDTFVELHPTPTTGQIEYDTLFATRSPKLTAQLLPGEMHQISKIAHELTGSSYD